MRGTVHFSEKVYAFFISFTGRGHPSKTFLLCLELQLLIIRALMVSSLPQESEVECVSKGFCDF